MPKRSTVLYTSEDAAADVAQESGNVHTYFCRFTGELALMLTKALSELPRRRTDGAFIVDRSEVMARLQLREGGVRAIRRRGTGEGEGNASGADGEGRVEKQWRLVTKKGSLPVAYRVEADVNARYLYVLQDALTITPGGAAVLTADGERVPPCISDAGEGNVHVAINVRDRGARTCVLAINDDEVTLQTAAEARLNAANAEARELLAKVLDVGQRNLSLGKGWSHKSRILFVRAPPGVRLDAAEVYAKLKGAISEADTRPGFGGGSAPPVAAMPPTA